MFKKIFYIILGFYFLLLLAHTLQAAEITPKKKPFKYTNHLRIQLHIKRNEGFSSRVYLDTKGFKTVGYGHKLPNKTDLEVGDFVSMERINRWFINDYYTALHCARRYLKRDYNTIELMVITDMAFNLGCTTLNDFWRLRKHINNKDYNMAVKAIRGSLYYKQVKNRADRNITLLKQL